MKTRVAVLQQMGLPRPCALSRSLQIVELELAPPGPGELLVRVTAAGLCHSDLSVIGARPRPMPTVLAHEAAGVIETLGPGTAGFAPGDHVVLAFVPMCGDCLPCVALYQAGKLPVDRLLTHRLRLEEVNEGFDRLAEGQAVRQVIVIQEEGQGRRSGHPVMKPKS
jgi:Zn-dependent alcohol dehydrogenase